MVSDIRDPDESAGSVTFVAFLATAPGTGRTRMVANISALLACEGRRVLVLDLDAEQPTLHSYLERFVEDDNPELEREVLDAAATLLEPAPRPVAGRPAGERYSAFRYALPGSSTSIDLLGRRAGSSWRPSLATKEHMALLRRACVAAGYDYVLFDLPQPADVTQPGVIVESSDTAVISFLPTRDATTPAVDLATALIEITERTIPIVVVPAVLDATGSARGQRSSNLAMRSFSPLMSASSGALVQLVGVPYRPDQARLGVLAMLVDEPGDKDSLAAAYEDVCAAITGEPVSAGPRVPELARLRYQAALGLVESTDVMWLAYTPQDRRWADWIAAQVRPLGLPVRRLPAGGVVRGAGSVVAIVTSRFIGSEAYHDMKAAQSSGEPHTVAVAVEGEVPGSDLPGVVDLTGLNDATARRKLLAATWVFDRSPVAPAGMSMPRVAIPPTLAEGNARRGQELPTPSPRFVGRDDLLEKLRDLLCPLDGGTSDEQMRAGGMRTVTITGESGVGKSELARTYVKRFAGMYDRVAWIPATDRQTVRAQLVKLADALYVLPSGEPAEAALVALTERTPPSARWLLVYDNASAEAVEGLLPPGGRGDVIITALRPIPTAGGRRMTVGGLAEKDGAAVLRNPVVGVPSLSDADVKRIAQELDYLPVALSLAAAWLRDRWNKQRRQSRTEDAAAHAAAELRSQLEERTDLAVAATPVQRMVALNIDTLVDPVAVALARMCVFVASNGVSLRLLLAQTTLEQLAELTGSHGQPLIQDEAQFDRVLWIGARSGLFDLDRGEPAVLRIHPVIQEALREVTDPRVLRSAQAHMLYSMARYVSSEIESDSRRNEDLAELQIHLAASGATAYDFVSGRDPVLGYAGAPGSKGWVVRRWLVGQIRFLYTQRSLETWRSAIALAEKMDKAWVAVFGAGDELVWRLAAQRANIYRDLGEFQKALDIDMLLLSDQRRRLGAAHPRTLATARGFGGDLRFLGRFEEALAEDESTWLGFRETYGEDHPDTLMVAFNLANSRRVMGRLWEALELETISYPRRARVFGESHRWTVQSRRNLAIYLAELGSYDEALRHLDGNRATLSKIYGEGEHEEWLFTERIRLTIWRRTGQMDNETVIRDGRKLLEKYKQNYGTTSRWTRECALSHAFDLHVDGQSEQALEIGLDCLRASAGQYGPSHPWTSAISTNVALFHNRTNMIAEAVATAGKALRQLADKLDETHPWALVAASNLGVILANAGNPGGARPILENARDHSLEYLGKDHPITGAAQHNLNALTVEQPVWRELDIDLN
jgi:Mrp family chromosome partitioning ATPase/tetratricopeptide (TPR) repeat protein